MVEIASTPPPRADALAHHVRLRDGVLIQVRPIRRDDGERVRRMHARLSHATIMSRYFHAVPFLSDAMIVAATHVDYLDRMALVAAMGTSSAPNPSAPTAEIVSIVNYERISADAAEIAFLVEDAWQGRGIASILFYDLAAYACTSGFRRLLAVTLSRNTRMLDLLSQCGFPCTLRGGGDEEVAAWLDITSSPSCQFTRLVL